MPLQRHPTSLPHAAVLTTCLRKRSACPPARAGQVPDGRPIRLPFPGMGTASRPGAPWECPLVNICTRAFARDEARSPLGRRPGARIGFSRQGKEVWGAFPGLQQPAMHGAPEQRRKFNRSRPPPLRGAPTQHLRRDTEHHYTQQRAPAGLGSTRRAGTPQRQRDPACTRHALRRCVGGMHACLPRARTVDCFMFFDASLARALRAKSCSYLRFPQRWPVCIFRRHVATTL